MNKRMKQFMYAVIESIIQMIGYALVFMCVATFFDTFHVDDTHLYLYGIAATIIIFILNKTIKPILFFLTLPITGITVGIFYPCINLFILKLTDWLLRDHFEINNIFIGFFLAILISVINVFLDNIVVQPIMRRIKKYE